MGAVIASVVRVAGVAWLGAWAPSVAADRDAGVLFPGRASPAAWLMQDAVGADMDGDGDPDIALCRGSPISPQFDSRVMVLFNNDGGFEPGPQVDVGKRPVSIAAGDLDDDGDVDLVTANEDDGSVTLLLNAGDGSLSVGRPVLPGGEPSAVGLADLFGSGLPELVVADSSTFAWSLLIYPNLGPGPDGPLWGEPILVTPTYRAGRIRFADLDADGDLDIVCGAGSAVRTVFNLGDGAFGEPAGPSVSFADSRLAVGDLNADGLPDIAVPSSGGARVFFNRGGGVFSESPDHTLPVSCDAAEIVDTNADGVPDLVLWTDWGSVAVIRPDGAGGVELPEYAAGGDGVAATIIADFNSDGRVDAATLNDDDQSVTLLRGRENGRFETREGLAAGWALLTDDVDGDGSVDFLVHIDDEFWIQFNDGAGRFTAVPTGITPPAHQITPSPFTADLDADGDADIVHLNTVYENTGDGFFPRFHLPEGRGFGLGYATGAADLNGDGVLDLFGTTDGGREVTVWIGDEHLDFTQTIRTPVERGFRQLWAMDVDGDGVTDLVGYRSENSNLYTFINDGAGALTPIATGLTYIYAGVAFGDLNSDGLPDVVSSIGYNWVEVRLNAGQGLFGPVVEYACANGARNPVIADIDEDGKQDIVVASQAADRWSVLFNHGDGTFGPAHTGPTVNNPDAVKLADVDLDGLTDMVLFGVSQVGIVLNEGSRAFAPSVGFTGTGSRWVDDIDADGDADVLLTRSQSVAVLRNTAVDAVACPPDLAEPFGTLNFFDLSAYLALYNAGDPAADLAEPSGVLNFFDVSAYLAAYNAGCP